MKRNIVATFLIVSILQSCSPKIKANLSIQTYDALEPEREVLIIKETEKLPENSKYVGELKVGDSGFSTDCGYSKVISEAKKTAQKSGANLIHLTEVKKPNLGSTCYRIKAKLYRNLDENVLANFVNKRESEIISRLSPESDYAVVYFYRPKNYVGSLIGYKIKMDDDKVIGRVRNGEKFKIKITDFGEHEFSGKTESKHSVVIDVRKGQEYFVRCGITMGFGVGKPELYIIENEIGAKEYESLPENEVD